MFTAFSNSTKSVYDIAVSVLRGEYDARSHFMDDAMGHPSVRVIRQGSNDAPSITVNWSIQNTEVAGVALRSFVPSSKILATMNTSLRAISLSGLEEWIGAIGAALDQWVCWSLGEDGVRKLFQQLAAVPINYITVCPHIEIKHHEDNAWGTHISERVTIYFANHIRLSLSISAILFPQRGLLMHPWALIQWPCLMEVKAINPVLLFRFWEEQAIAMLPSPHDAQSSIQWGERYINYSPKICLVLPEAKSISTEPKYQSLFPQVSFGSEWQLSLVPKSPPLVMHQWIDQWVDVLLRTAFELIDRDDMF